MAEGGPKVEFLLANLQKIAKFRPDEIYGN